MPETKARRRVLTLLDGEVGFGGIVLADSAGGLVHESRPVEPTVLRPRYVTMVPREAAAPLRMTVIGLPTQIHDELQ